jgi:NAD(P)-dependent dehydrogenase (short-subunit alcohol dehydrogenase family)
MSDSQILKGKTALVFGAGGSVGSAVAKELAAEGAEVFLSGRTRGNVDEVTKQIEQAGGRVHADVVDALDADAVGRYVDGIVTRAGHVDIEFNAVGPLAGDYGNGRSALDITVDQFMIPVSTVLKSQFITARAVARHMVSRRAGVIVLLTGGPARSHVEGTAAIGSAFGAVESLTRTLALDLSPLGVRVVCVRSSAMTDSRTIRQTLEALASRLNVPAEQFYERIANLTMLKTTASVRDTARAVAFVASDRARMMTSNVINATGGAVGD